MQPGVTALRALSASYLKALAGLEVMSEGSSWEEEARELYPHSQGLLYSPLTTFYLHFSITQLSTTWWS